MPVRERRKWVDKIIEQKKAEAKAVSNEDDNDSSLSTYKESN
jgi:hypothetical protein